MPSHLKNPLLKKHKQCIFCKSLNIKLMKKNFTKRKPNWNYQYKCLDCKKVFTSTTNHYMSGRRLDYRIVKYIRYMAFKNKGRINKYDNTKSPYYSIREIKNKVNFLFGKGTISKNGVWYIVTKLRNKT